MADVNVTIHFDISLQNPFSYSGPQVQSDGDMTVDLPKHGSKTIRFDLDSTVSTDTMAGIRISQNQEDLKEGAQNPAPAVSGGEYTGTPFIVTTTPPSLFLVDQDRPNEVDAGNWFYALGVRHHDGSVTWDDPKVHNQGDDVPEGDQQASGPKLTIT